MCGITGWVDWKRDLTRERDVVEAMGATLTHRGPDTGETWISTPAAFAHRRLVVVDPEGGGQPMVRRCRGQSYVIVYNGELYNTSDVRRELEARGHLFKGYSDTEALLLSYIEWGPACLERLNGIFAFAVWNQDEEILFMARDRLGVKPLFLAQRGSALLFGSELKALLANPLVSPEVGAEGLAELLVMGPARTPGHGLLRGVEELRPGRYLLHTRRGTSVRRYWSLESKPHTDGLKTTAARVRWLLEDAVRRQLVADVPVCTFLSGGLDSSAVTAFAADEFRRTVSGRLHTWSVDYAGNDHSFQPSHLQPDADAPWARRVSELLGTEHHAVTIATEDLVQALDHSLRANDLPGMVDIDSSLYLLCREIRREATVALSGEAADEVFGGYPWFRDAEALSGGTFPWSRSVPERATLLSPWAREALRPEEYAAARYEEALQEVPRLPGESPPAARMRELCYLNITRFMPTLLDRKDRMSMAVGLEVRVPYCDHRLVEYVWNIPWEMKSIEGREKGILRQALTGLLPDDVLYRRKSPYPKTHHPVYREAMRVRLLEVLNDPSSPVLPLLDVNTVKDLAETGAPAFGPAWFGQLMGPAQLFAYLVLVNEWLDTYHIMVA